MTSLESIVSQGLFGNTSGKKSAKYYHGIESILYDSTRDSETYAFESASNLAAAEMLNMYIDNLNESMEYTTSIIFKIKKDYGLENINVSRYVFGAEDNKGVLNKVGEFFKKAWTAIVEFFKRLLISVSNFVKQIQVWISGPIAKSQSSFYSKNKSKIEEALKAVGDDVTIKALPLTNDDPNKIYDKTIKEFNKKLYSKYSPSDLENMISDVSKVSGKGLTNIVSRIEENEKKLKEVYNEMLSKGGKNIKLTIYRSFFKISQDGNIKSENIKVNTFSPKLIDGYLSENSYKFVKDSLNDGKKTIANISSAVKSSEKMLKTTINELKKPDKNASNEEKEVYNETIKSIKKVTSYVNLVKKSMLLTTSALLTGFNCYMKARSYCMTACRVALKSNKKKEKK